MRLRSALLAAVLFAGINALAGAAHAGPFLDPVRDNGGVCPSYYSTGYCDLERDADVEWELAEHEFARCKFAAAAWRDAHPFADGFEEGRRTVACMTAAGYSEHLSPYSDSATVQRVLGKWRAAGRPAADLITGAIFYQQVRGWEDDAVRAVDALERQSKR